MRRHDRLLMQIVSTEMLVQFAQTRVALQESAGAVLRCNDGKSRADHIAPIAGISGIAARRQRRRVHGGQRGKHRMAVLEVDAGIAQQAGG